MNRVDAVFRRLRTEGRKAFMPFIPAGDPALAATAAVLKTLESSGVADVVELGVPFSDPVADGPVIQSSFHRALVAGTTPQGVFDMLADLRGQGFGLPVCLMVSYSLVYRPGVEVFVERASAAGADGLIVPDLPVDEAEPLGEALAARDMSHVLLIAPTTPPARRKKIIARATGFIYCMSVVGITGERSTLPRTLDDYVRGVKKVAKVPVCVGFGISRPEHVEAVAAVADGAIVGSALVRRIAESSADPPDVLARSVADLCERLSAPLRR